MTDLSAQTPLAADFTASEALHVRRFFATPAGAPVRHRSVHCLSSCVFFNFTLTGTQLNGISAGATYGDDAEMDTNYPIIQLKAKDGSGKVYSRNPQLEFYRCSYGQPAGEH